MQELLVSIDEHDKFEIFENYWSWYTFILTLNPGIDLI